MGAKVFHFEWISDFAAAKNFAIEQCGGNWIAFLDADEYFDETDAKLLKGYLERVEADPAQRKEINNLQCRRVDVDDNGVGFNIGEQERVFRNMPENRYVGAIHEYLPPHEGRIFIKDLKIYHTGYSAEAKKDKNTTERNRKMIEAELEKEPDNYIMKGYLADTLKDGSAENTARVVEIYEEIRSHRHEPNVHMNFMLNNAYAYLTNYYIRQGPQYRDTAMEVVKEASEFAPTNPDYDFYQGRIYQLYDHDYATAWEHYKRSESIAFQKDMPKSFYVLANLDKFLIAMMETANELHDNASVVKYTTVLIQSKRDDLAVIGSLMTVMLAIQPDISQTVEMLGRFYDFNNISDKVFLARAAVKAKRPDLAHEFMEMITEADENWIYDTDGTAENAEVSETTETVNS
jgi:glycosyltransferase involved in cell wall biosynthesis